MLSSIEGFKSVVLDQLGEGVIVADADGRIISVNRAAEEIHGRVRLDVPTVEYTQTYELLTMDDLPYPPDELPLARAVNRGELVIEEPWKIKRPDGSVVIAVGTARPVLNAEGKQIGSVLTMRDDTKRVQAEQALVSALEMKDILLFEVNHRVRNSLQIVSSIISLPLHRIEDEVARETLALTQQRIEVISATHRSLYELGLHNEVDCVILLQDLCENIVETYSLDSAVRLEWDRRGSIILPVSKAVSVCLTVTELITNACKYAFRGRDAGTIRVLLDGADEKITIRVEDDGVGMPEPESDRRSSRGIGMILVESLAKSVAADVRIDSGESGTRFTITFDRPEPESDLSEALVLKRRARRGVDSLPE
ncbi:sensor histidine kinase [Hyphomonas johnsonii]|uniref:histidine kinase n=1 Tax=Hyphomonas johnsonii MHS-2 TaxID=1280950 RepID=A0A059F967_9PROT|nr:histidine kinase dimerization/phosphoacceptor domain -containing protein [Hyphomonas johnsonii]KCZ87145.1 PAS domain S-box [Hyphomonas johnsonii MHS-2]